MVSALTISGQRTMFTANAFVIYFTIGVPFGVLSIYLTSGRLMAIKAAWFTAHLALWPAFAAKALARSLLPSKRSARSSNKPLFQSLRSRCETAIPETINAGKRRSLLFEFDRLIALSDAVTEARENAQHTAVPIHALVEHPFPIVAAKCLKRKLRSQLSRHQNDAYLSIYNLIDEQGINLPNPIASELNALVERNSATISASDVAKDRLAA